jgi:hypothetical protein
MEQNDQRKFSLLQFQCVGRRSHGSLHGMLGEIDRSGS